MSVTRDPDQTGRAGLRPIRREASVPAAPRRPARPRAGIGGQADLRYCSCGAKKRDGNCVRGCDQA